MMPEIVKYALVYTVVDIGQLTSEQRRDLKSAVKVGHLSKGKGGPFPILKTVYAHPGFDFAADRESHIAEMREAIEIDRVNGVSFFPEVRFR